MPNTRECPDCEHIENVTRNRNSVSAKGYVNVIAEEGGKRYVPSSPEIRYRIGNVGIIEVFFVVESNHKSHTDSHIGISGEVEI